MKADDTMSHSTLTRKQSVHPPRGWSPDAGPAVVVLGGGPTADQSADFGGGGKLARWVDGLDAADRSDLLGSIAANLRPGGDLDRYREFCARLIDAYRADVYGFTGTDWHPWRDRDCNGYDFHPADRDDDNGLIPGGRVGRFDAVRHDRGGDRGPDLSVVDRARRFLSARAARVTRPLFGELVAR